MRACDWLTVHHLQPLISLLSPVYWTAATQLNNAVNGLTLTHGHFHRDTRVEFATGITALHVLTMPSLRPEPFY